MTDLTAVSQWSPVRQLEKTDQAIAGPGGIMNAQAQALANRTQYLKDNSATKSELAAKSSGYYKSYATLASANADIAKIPFGTSVKVLSATDGGEYYKATSNATMLTKSEYDPEAKVTALLNARDGENDTADARINTALQMIAYALAILREDYDADVLKITTDIATNNSAIATNNASIAAIKITNEQVKSDIARILVAVENMIVAMVDNRADFDSTITTLNATDTSLQNSITAMTTALSNLSIAMNTSNQLLAIALNEIVSPTP